MRIARFALAVASLTVAACAAQYPTPPAGPTLDGVALRRFARVADGVYRSGQPDAEQWRELASKYGIKTVVKLNHGSEPAPAGVTLVDLPISATDEPSPERLAKILDAIDAAEKPVLIHCTHGEDRTGLIVALWRMRHGTPTNDAFADMIRHGFHPFDGVWSAWIHSAKWDRQEPDPVAR